MVLKQVTTAWQDTHTHTGPRCTYSFRHSVTSLTSLSTGLLYVWMHSLYLYTHGLWLANLPSKHTTSHLVGVVAAQ